MNYKKFLTLSAFVIIIGLVIYASSQLQNLIIGLANYLGDYFRENIILGGLLFFGISIVAVLISPFSSVPLVPSAIMAWGSFATLALIFPAWIIGGMLAYYVGSLSREKIIRHFFSLEKIEYYKKHISPRSQFWLVLLFRLAVPSEIASYTLGIIRYHFGKYLLITALTELPFALIVIYSGSVLVRGRVLFFAVIVTAVAAIFYYLYREFHRRIRSQ